MGKVVDFKKPNKKPVRNNKAKVIYTNKPKNPVKSKDWMKIVLALFFIFSIYGYVKNTGISDFNKTQEQIDQEAYDEIYEAINECKTMITFVGKKADYDYISVIYEKVVDEHPELFWVSGGALFQTSGDVISKSMSFSPHYRYSKDEIPKMKKTFDKEIKIWLKGISDKQSDYEKALAIHDRIVQNVVYDEEVYQRSKNNEDFYDDAYNAYGCLVTKRAVCEGYSRAYQMLLQESGVETGVISGEATDSQGETGGHAWNYIKLDDGYYLVDVTWDDPLGNNGIDIRHDYFCLNNAQMGINHTPGDIAKVPKCDGVKFNIKTHGRKL